MKPLVGGADAERIAVAVAPLLPLLLLMFSLALTMKRLVQRQGLAAADHRPALRLFDHRHVRAAQDRPSWLAAGVARAGGCRAWPIRKRARGGAVLGIATGLSLAIGLEMMIYLALLGGATVLLWVADRDQRRRLAAYAASLVATTGAGLPDLRLRRQPPGGVRRAVAGLAERRGGRRRGDARSGDAEARRLEGAARRGGRRRRGWSPASTPWPGPIACSGWRAFRPRRPTLWLDHVREARPFYRHGWRIATMALALPVTALFGWALLIWRAWKRAPEDATCCGRTLAVALPAIAALALLFWQIRAGPAAQMMALPAATALIVLVAGALAAARPSCWQHVAAVVLVAARLSARRCRSGCSWCRPRRSRHWRRKVAAGQPRCPSLAALAPIQRQPKGMIFTFIDLGPRLIVATHHDAVGGPYHRNDQAIADVMKAFRGDEAQAHRIIREYRSDYLLICPNMSTATIFMAEAPERLLRPAGEGQGAGLAAAGRAAQGFAVQDVEGGRLAGQAGQAALQPVEHELGGQRGEDHAEDAGDHRLQLGADQLHQRPGERAARPASAG